MPIFLLAIFLKGPVWLRGLVMLGFAGILLFACVSTARTFRTATERTPTAHVPHTRKH